ncbi:MAG TPA: tandem-95 repeat protein [Thermodesulfobacteriota bacterium]|nr:tandem-95 repeat protein [Deltaproteobacteria bacterium]HNR12750.1 tandem-95 repeat protein [Thermodesulfobacteriota bacterium]HNU71608.1 tandem-95 repeat protein [Thermodesulfobacteriota bacterium]HOC37754.1 tandem-95 repeat protein [Thermodesulfobacteriota bacterium]HQO77764.1 tandem-95 repeat protein [Thermodesulfobacteriota bacterium]
MKNLSPAFPRKKLAGILLILFIALEILCQNIHAQDVDCSYVPKGELFQNVTIAIQDPLHGTINRTFDYYVPSSIYPADPRNQPPLLFILHGRNASADAIFGTAGYYDWGYPWCRMMKEADEENFIICAPDGWTNSDGERTWNDCQNNDESMSTTDDVLFIQNLIRWFIKNDYNIDANRVYAAGFSNGASMVFRLAAELDDKIAAIAAVGANMPRPTESECDFPTGKVGIFIMTGTLDPLVPYENMEALVGYWVLENELSMNARFQKLPDGYKEESSTNVWGDLHCYDMPSNAEGTQVLHYTIHNGGHCEPSISEGYPDYYKYDLGLGLQCRDFEVAEEAWSFLRTQSLAEERVYRPVVSQVRKGVYNSGDPSTLWLEEPEAGGSYTLTSSSGETLLEATFKLMGTGDLSSLQASALCRTTATMPRALYLWNYTLNGTGGWEIITSDTCSSKSKISLTMPFNTTKYVNAKGEVRVAVGSGSSSSGSHQLMVDVMEVRVVYFDSDGETLQAVNDQYSATEDLSLAPSTPILANDLPSSGTTAVLVDDVLHGTLTLNSNGSFTYKPLANFNGNDFFTYQAVSDSRVSNTATVTITVQPVNDMPVASPDTAETTQGAPVTISVLANDTDVDGNSLTLSSVTPGSTNGSVTINSDNTVTYTPIGGYAGIDSFSYQAYDGVTWSNTATVTVTVSAASNIPPVATNDSSFTKYNTPIVINVLANDKDADGILNPASVTIVSQPTRGTLVNNGNGTVTFTPKTNYWGRVTFTYTVKDNNGAVSNKATVTVNVLRRERRFLWQ